jgi:hypothetical protein
MDDLNSRLTFPSLALHRGHSSVFKPRAGL